MGSPGIDKDVKSSWSQVEEACGSLNHNHGSKAKWKPSGEEEGIGDWNQLIPLGTYTKEPIKSLQNPRTDQLVHCIFNGQHDHSPEQ